jgi:hypothetical protein
VRVTRELDASCDEALRRKRFGGDKGSERALVTARLEELTAVDAFSKSLCNLREGRSASRFAERLSKEPSFLEYRAAFREVGDRDVERVLRFPLSDRRRNLSG